MTKQENYIIDAIDGEGYNVTFTDTVSKLQFLRETFYGEYGWHIAQVGEKKALAGWLAGLPSCCNIEWRNHKIIELGKEWGELSDAASEAREWAYLDHWFKNMAARIHTLWAKANLLEKV